MKTENLELSYDMLMGNIRSYTKELYGHEIDNIKALIATAKSNTIEYKIDLEHCGIDFIEEIYSQGKSIPLAYQVFLSDISVMFSLLVKNNDGINIVCKNAFEYLIIL